MENVVEKKGFPKGNPVLTIVVAAAIVMVVVLTFAIYTKQIIVSYNDKTGEFIVKLIDSS